MVTREEFIEELKRKLDDWNKSIDELEQRVQSVEASSRDTLQEQLQDLKKKRDSARNDLHTLQSASAEAFEDMRAGMELAWQSIGDSFRSALSRFRE